MGNKLKPGALVLVFGKFRARVFDVEGDTCEILIPLGVPCQWNSDFEACSRVRVPAGSCEVVEDE